MSTVKVKVTKEGNVITQNKNNTEFGYFLVEGIGGTVSFSNGWANVQRARQALVSMPWEALEQFASTGLMTGTGIVTLKEGVELTGKIVVKESVDQSELYDVAKVDETHGKKYRSAAHREADVPYCDADGMPIYQKKYFTENLLDFDVLVIAGNRADVDAFTEQQIAMKNTNLVSGFKVVAAPKGRVGATK